MHHGAVIGRTSDVFEVTFVDDVFVTACVMSRLVHVVPSIEGTVFLIRSTDTGGGFVADGGASHVRSFLLGVALEALLTTQIAAVLEHVARFGMEGPEGSFARFVGRTRHFDEAVVERERVADRVLPALLVLPIEREQVHDKLVDFAEREHFGRRVLYGHCDERDVGIGRLGVRVTSPVGFVVASAEPGLGALRPGRRASIEGSRGRHAVQGATSPGHGAHSGGHSAGKVGTHALTHGHTVGGGSRCRCMVHTWWRHAGITGRAHTVHTEHAGNAGRLWRARRCHRAHVHTTHGIGRRHGRHGGRLAHGHGRCGTDAAADTVATVLQFLRQHIFRQHH